MVEGKPKIREVLPKVLDLIGSYPIVGHGINFDIALIANEAKRAGIPTQILSQVHVDTLRLARLYGESPVNSLEKLRQHFNIEAEGAHRAMSDVIVNIEVFKYLSKSFQTTEQIFTTLQKPINLRLTLFHSLLLLLAAFSSLTILPLIFSSSKVRICAFE